MHTSHHSLHPTVLRIVAPAIVELCALTIYWLTLQPGLSGGDSAEAQFVPYTLSIMHYTGYPLYTILGYMWSHLLTIGDVAYRMNLLSAFSGAAAVAGIVLVVDIIGASQVGGLLAAVLLGASTLFWDWSTKAGVRSLNVAFVVAIIGLAVIWSRKQAGHTSANDRYWLGMWLIVGLSLAHHRTSILLMPGLAIYIVWTRPRIIRDWQAILSAALMLLPGLLTYFYPIWRGLNHPVYQPLPVDSFEHFLDLVLARNLSDLVMGITLQQVPERLNWLIEYLVAQFGNIGLVTAFAGLILLLLRQPREGVLIWIFLLLLTAFTIDYRIEGMAKLNVVFLLPVHAIICLGSAYLLGSLLHFGVKVISQHTGVRYQYGTKLVFNVLGLLVIAALSYPLVRQSLDWVYMGVEKPLYAYREELRGQQAERLTLYGEDSVTSHPVIVGEWEQMAAFWYQQLVNRRWVGAEFRYPVIANLGLFIDQAWQSGREIYITHAVPGLGDGRQLSMDGALIHVLRQPETAAPTRAFTAQVDFADGLSLVGYRLYTNNIRPGRIVPVSIFWKANQPLMADDSISIRLQREDGTQIAQEDAVHPVLGSFPTTHWTQGAVVGDYYELALPPSTSPGEYRLSAVVYQRQADGSSRIVRNSVSNQEISQFGVVNISSAQ